MTLEKFDHFEPLLNITELKKSLIDYINASFPKDKNSDISDFNKEYIKYINEGDIEGLIRLNSSLEKKIIYKIERSTGNNSDKEEIRNLELLNGQLIEWIKILEINHLAAS